MKKKEMLQEIDGKLETLYANLTYYIDETIRKELGALGSGFGNRIDKLEKKLLEDIQKIADKGFTFAGTFPMELLHKPNPYETKIENFKL